MKTKQFFKTGLLIFAILVASCSGEDGLDGENGINGIDGAQGLVGPQGEPGQDGIDGEDGEDGTDGEDGEDGTDGQDGENSLLAFYEFNISNKFDKNRITLLIPDKFTDEESREIAVLVYMGSYFSTVGPVFSLYPGILCGKYYANISPYLSLSEVWIDFYDSDFNRTIPVGCGAGNARVLLLKIDSEISAKSSKDFSVYFKDKGVDINNYQQVANYFGLED